MLCWALTPDGSAGTSAIGFGHSLSTGLVLRQIRVGPGCRSMSRSVVSVGAVQVRRTLLPLRVARKSLTGCGSPSDGGLGMPGTPHASKHEACTSNKNWGSRGFIAGKPRLTEERQKRAAAKTEIGAALPDSWLSTHQFFHSFAEHTAVQVHVSDAGLWRH